MQSLKNLDIALLLKKTFAELEGNTKKRLTDELLDLNESLDLLKKANRGEPADATALIKACTEIVTFLIEVKANVKGNNLLFVELTALMTRINEFKKNLMNNNRPDLSLYTQAGLSSAGKVFDRTA